MTRSRRGHSAGFTLMEVLVSSAVMGIVLVAIGSAILVTSRALPGERNSNQSLLISARKLDFITAELAGAVTVTEWTPTAVTFTVADRTADSDGDPETIRYAWAGEPGDPITRRQNGGEAAVFLENVEHFNVSGDLKEVPGDGQPQEGQEKLLVSHTPGGGTLVYREVGDLNWPGQYFRPVLAGGATGWRITRIRFQAKRAGFPNGLLMPILARASADCVPVPGVLAWTTIDEVTLSEVAYTWQEFPVVGTPVFDPDEGAVLILAHGGGDTAAWVRYEQGGQDTPDAHYVLSVNSGATWTYQTSIDLVFEVYGKVTASDTGSRYYLQAGRLALQTCGDAASRVQTGVTVYNQPEVPGP